MGNISADSESAQDLIKIHQSLKPISLSTYLNQLTLLASTLQQFASLQPQFQSLSQDDQDILLRNNIPLYLQYVTARYLNAKSGLEQLTWILEGNIFLDFTKEVEDLSVVPFDEFIWELVIFRSSEMFHMYSDYLQLIENFFSFPHYFNALVANVLLYSTTELMRKELKDPQKVEILYLNAIKLAENELSLAMNYKIKFDLSTLSFALLQMNNIFKNIEVHSRKMHLSSKVPRAYNVSFDDVEENWLIQKFERLQVGFSSVAPTEKMMQEVILVFTNLSPGCVI